jgi:uncharacterized protein (DUF427 family)
MSETGGAGQEVRQTFVRAILPELEPVPRWVRLQFAGQYVADSKRVLLSRYGGNLNYYFPEGDVRLDWLAPGARSARGLLYYNLRVGDRAAEAAAWRHESSGQEALRGYLAFDWSKLDHCYEEEEEVFVHPRDPYRRIDTRRSAREVRIEVGGQLVAESRRPVLLFETGLPIRYYLPGEDVRLDLLEKSERRTGCPYKGFASYWSLVVGEKVHRNLVWSYEAPFLEAQPVIGMYCFPSERVDLYVDGQKQERPETPWAR